MRRYPLLKQGLPVRLEKKGVFSDACLQCGKLLSRTMRAKGHVCGKGRR